MLWLLREKFLELHFTQSANWKWDSNTEQLPLLDNATQSDRGEEEDCADDVDDEKGEVQKQLLDKEKKKVKYLD